MINFFKKKIKIKRNSNSCNYEADDIFDFIPKEKKDNNQIIKKISNVFFGYEREYVHNYLPTIRKEIVLVGLLCICFIPIIKLVILRINKYDFFVEKATQNRFKEIPIFATRGLIVDRNNVPLAWNVQDVNEKFLKRQILDKKGMGNIVGYLRYPKKDRKGFYWDTQLVGKYGLELAYDKQLSGKNGYEYSEVSAKGKKQNFKAQTRAIAGETITTTIDSIFQTSLYTSIESLATSSNYHAGGGVILDPINGEIIALVSYPTFDANIMNNPIDKQKLSEYLTSKKQFFLQRPLMGTYSPGSIVKPFVALMALHTGIITPQTSIFSSGSIKVSNPFNPEKPSIFKDWKKGGHGMTNLDKAIAESVNTFFYAISGGFGSIPKGIGIENIDIIMKSFGLGQKTGIEKFEESVGIVPSPQWKEKVFGESWRLGDTYITGIGQFGFSVTPIQMARAMGGLITKGTLATPTLIKSHKKQLAPKVSLSIQDKDYEAVLHAMQQTVTNGTAKVLDIKGFNARAKTGTAQLGKQKQFVNSWVIASFEYQGKTYVSCIVMEKGPKNGAVNASWALAKTLLEVDSLRALQKK